MVKQLMITSELSLGLKVEMIETIHTSHKAILFHLPVEIGGQPPLGLHEEVFLSCTRLETSIFKVRLSFALNNNPWSGTKLCFSLGFPPWWFLWHLLQEL